MTLGEKLLSIKRETLFMILILATSIPLFFNVTLPNQPKPEAISFFEAANGLKEGDTVIIQSDWTEGTRGESRGSMDALLRILTRRGVKFAILSVADPQAPEVARNVMADINKERAKEGKQPYRKWDDWVELGFFPNGEALGKSISANLRNAVGSKLDGPDGGAKKPVFESPVLKDIKLISDVDMYFVVTGTKSIIIAIERFAKQTKMAGMVTGVMGPETYNYYVSGQLVGLVAGLKGVYDVESQMAETYKGEGEVNLDKGTKYIFTLHVGIFLLILAVVIGNVGVFLTRGAKK